MSAIGSARFNDVEKFSRPCKKNEVHKVGEWYWNSYWNYVYVVRIIEGSLVTCYTPADGREWSHRTPLDWRKDRVMTTENPGRSARPEFSRHPDFTVIQTSATYGSGEKKSHP